MVFASVLAHHPRSHQALRDNLGPYIEDLRARFRDRFGDHPPFDGALYCRIIWFHRVRVATDVDNIIKPIQDAMQGVVCHDDRQIAQCAARRVDNRSVPADFELSTRGIPPELYDELIRALGARHVVYVESGRLESKLIRFGPIDGGSR